MIAAQSRQLIEFLKTQSVVDGEQTALYGLPWGDKEAEQMPNFAAEVQLIICSRDFDEWI